MTHESDIIAQIMGRKPAVVVEEITESKETLSEDGHRPTGLEKEFAARDAGMNLANFGDEEEEEIEDEEEEEMKEEVTRQMVMEWAVRKAFKKLRSSDEKEPSGVITHDDDTDWLDRFKAGFHTKIGKDIEKRYGYQTLASQTKVDYNGTMKYSIIVQGPGPDFNSTPLSMTFAIIKNTVYTSNNVHSVKPLRKTTFKSLDELNKIIMKYIDKNRSKFDKIVKDGFYRG